MKARERIYQIFVAIVAIIVIATIQSCSQTVINPDLSTPHRVTLRTLTNTDKPVPNVSVSLYLDPQHTSQIGTTQLTDATGTANFSVAIPVFGHAYSILVQSGTGTSGTAAISRVIDVFLQCQDTLLPIYLDIPEADTTTLTDCTNSWQPETITLHACPSDSAVKAITISNGCAGPVTYTITPVALASPFSLSIVTNGTKAGNTVTLQPSGILNLTVTYYGAGQSQDQTTSVSIAGSSGTIPITIVGSPRKDCNTPPETVDCSSLSLAPQTIDFGTVCNTKTSGPSCTTIDNTGTETMQIVLPAVPAPFFMTVRDNTGGIVTANPITLAPNQSLSLCFSIANASVGAQSAKFNAVVTCPTSGKTSTMPITLNAQVEKCDTCDCPSAAITEFDLTQSIDVVAGDTSVTVPIFTNTTSCDVTVSPSGPLSGDDWSLVPQTSFSDVVSPNGVLQKTFRFTPRAHAGTHTFTMPLQLLVGPQKKVCSGQVTLRGPACRSMCFIIQSTPTHIYPKHGSDLYDTVWTQEAGNVKVQVSYPGNVNTSVPECFTLLNPDTSCNTNFVTISTPAAPFGVSPSGTIAIAPGAKQDVCITFTAPTVEQVRAHGSLIYSDHLTISQSSNCRNDYTLYAVVDTFQHCKVDQNLIVYSQFTAQQRAPLYQVYDFASDKVWNQVQPTTSGGSIPSTYDLYLQDGLTLAITSKGGLARGLHVLASDPLFSDFCNNAEQIITKYQPQLGGFSYTTTATIAQGDVVAVELGNNTYALLFVTDAGAPPDVNGLNYVQFIVIYSL
jgi:hypothetical protein